MGGWRIALVAGAGLAAFGAPARGQNAARPAADYAAVVQAYAASHDAALAVAPLIEWTDGQFGTAVEKYPSQPQPRFTAAAVLHLEIAAGIVTRSPVGAAKHLEFGVRLVRSARMTGRNVPQLTPAETAQFTERWFVAAASTLLSVNDPARAAPFIGRGLAVAPKSADLRLMSGILDEMSALSTNSDESRSASQISRMILVRTQALSRAKGTYQKLLADEPRFTRARVRLGRVLWLLDERDEALVELLRAQRETREPVQRYLAAMFLGALHEQAGNLADARMAFETALAAAPASQAATVALGHLDVMAGRPDRAQALARQLLSKPPVGDEWWSYRNGGFEMAALVWLRQQVWR